jgi:hypothetical protein
MGKGRGVKEGTWVFVDGWTFPIILEQNNVPTQTISPH